MPSLSSKVAGRAAVKVATPLVLVVAATFTSLVVEVRAVPSNVYDSVVVAVALTILASYLKVYPSTKL